MKRFFGLLQIALLFFVLLSGVMNSSAFGQVPPPPPPNGGPNNGHGLGGNQGPAGAPIGGGIEIILLMSSFYVVKKSLSFPIKKEQD
jgi:hypothetical protein